MSLPMEIQMPQPNAVGNYRFLTEFYYKPVEDRAASQQSGHAVFVDEDWVIITLPGSKNAHHKKVDQAVLDEWEHGKWQNGAMVKPPAPFAVVAYRHWKRGEEAPVNGTALKNWPPATPAFIKTCHAIGIFAVEDLASLNDDGVRRLGPGGVNWKQKATLWLQQADEKKSVGRIADLETENTGLKETIASLSATMRALTEQVKALEAGQPVVSVPIVHFPDDGRNSGSNDPDERDALIAEGEQLGVKLDRRMKPETMRERIREAQGQ